MRNRQIASGAALVTIAIVMTLAFVFLKKKEPISDAGKQPAIPAFSEPKGVVLEEDSYEKNVLYFGNPMTDEPLGVYFQGTYFDINSTGTLTYLIPKWERQKGGLQTYGMLDTFTKISDTTYEVNGYFRAPKNSLISKGIEAALKGNTSNYLAGSVNVNGTLIYKNSRDADATYTVTVKDKDTILVHRDNQTLIATGKYLPGDQQYKFEFSEDVWWLCPHIAFYLYLQAAAGKLHITPR